MMKMRYEAFQVFGFDNNNLSSSLVHALIPTSPLTSEFDISTFQANSTFPPCRLDSFLH